MTKYAKYVCSCGLSIGAVFNENSPAYCRNCKKNMKFKMVRNLELSDKKWNSIKYEDCK